MNLLNIGLNILDANDNVVGKLPPETPLLLIGARAHIHDVALHHSDTEETLVVAISRPLDSEDMAHLCAVLDQQAIAQVTDGKGVLYGPMAEKWGPFNPAFFLTLSGRRMSQEVSCA